MEGFFSFLFFVGLIAIIAMIHSIISKAAETKKSKVDQLTSENFALQKKAREWEKKYQDILDNTDKEFLKKKEKLHHDLAVMESTIQQEWKEQTLDLPWIADVVERAQEEYNNYLSNRLPARAYKSAEIVKELKTQNQALLKEKQLWENLSRSYEALFPWLEEFKTLSVEDALKYVRSSETSEDYEKNLRSWLSPEEYATLSSTQKNQLALDRYKKRPKSDWEIGIEYERYVGYTYEKQGYRVKYTGATEGLQDMGRDLLVYKSPSEILVIQCKRWSTEKTIHEKHIFQLFGTAFVLQVTNPSVKYIPVFYTTTSLSDVAKKCAEELNIVVYENYKCGEYPLIKCNLGRDEFGYQEKIYHLPFDQQYDRVAIDASKGEQYVYTIVEAEALGYRHAMRHFAS